MMFITVLAENFIDAIVVCFFKNVVLIMLTTQTINTFNFYQKHTKTQGGNARRGYLWFHGTISYLTNELVMVIHGRRWHTRQDGA
jgi:hypothetical protein